jgi:hypothetical protein
MTSRDITPTDSNVLAYAGPINDARAAARALDQRRQGMNGPVSDVRRRYTLAPGGMFPFKVYLAQLAFGPANNPTADNTSWWRTFLVRCGEVGGFPLSGSACDGYDLDPYGDYLPQQTLNDAGAALTPITVPSGAVWYFWVELWSANGVTSMPPALPYLQCGPNPASGAAPVRTTWTKYPKSDGCHFLLAKIDCQTNAARGGPAIIRQYLNQDIPVMMEYPICWDFSDGAGTVTAYVQLFGGYPYHNSIVPP